MTNDERQQIITLQKQGLGYKKIAATTGISVNTVKSFCRTHSFATDGRTICLHCGAPIQLTPHKKKKKFCSDRCRSAWWTAHPEMRKSSGKYEHTCLYCNQTFSSSRPYSKYCSVNCFGNARRKGQTI